ncbi:MAG: class I SAM-dependent methyltransferase [Candidatus Hodarchaeales archaeon]
MTSEKTIQEVEEVKNYFNMQAQRSEDDFTKLGELRKHTDLMLEFFEQQDLTGLSILELGCGGGRLLMKLLEMGAAHVYGTDLSEVIIKKAKLFAKAKKKEDQSTYFIGDFNSETHILPVNQVDIFIADRVFCCSPVALDLLERMIQFQPQYIVIALPRKSPLIRTLYIIKGWLQNPFARLRLGNSPSIPWYIYSVKDIDRICQQYRFTRVFQRFRYVWEVIIYYKQQES